MGRLQTTGIPELEAYKTGLIAYLSNLEPANLPSLDAVSKLVDLAEKDLKARISAWEKLQKLVG